MDVMKWRYMKRDLSLIPRVIVSLHDLQRHASQSQNNAAIEQCRSDTFPGYLLSPGAWVSSSSRLMDDLKPNRNEHMALDAPSRRK